MRLLQVGVFCFLLSIISCKERYESTHHIPIRPVKIINVKQEEKPVELHYIGVISSKDIKKYSFKMAGKIKRIAVKKGQKIHRGSLLAQLDDTDLSFALEAAEQKAKKAADAFEEAEKYYQKISKLHQKGVVPDDDLDKARLQRDIREADAKRAAVEVASKKSMILDTKMISGVNGFVVEVLNKEGEITGAGYPVVVVRNKRQVVNTGVSQRDIKKIRVGTKATLKVDDADGAGEVINISQVPDMESRTYNVEIELSDKLSKNEFYIGSIAHISFNIGKTRGIWIPIHSVQNDGEDYVFIVEKNRVVRKTVSLEKVSGMYVGVTGLNDGDQLIVEGMKNLKIGYQVKTIQ